jgi:archaellum component FlaC
MAGLLNLIEPKVGLKRIKEGQDYETEKNENYESMGGENNQDFQSVTGINGLLEEMMNNLNAMNENIETGKGILKITTIKHHKI